MKAIENFSLPRSQMKSIMSIVVKFLFLYFWDVSSVSFIRPYMEVYTGVVESVVHGSCGKRGAWCRVEIGGHIYISAPVLNVIVTMLGYNLSLFLFIWNVYLTSLRSWGIYKFYASICVCRDVCGGCGKHDICRKRGEWCKLE